VGQTKRPKKILATKTKPAAGIGTVKRPFVPVTLAAVIVIGVVLRVINLAGVASRSPDEAQYIYYASRIADQGLGVTPKLFADYESNSSNWVYPCPSRFGHVLLFAGAMKISGVRDASAGAAVSCLFSSLSLVLVTWIGLRFFNRWIALAGVTFLAFSVGELGMAQRAWQDATFSFLGLLLICLTCEITRSPRRFLLFPAFFAVGAYSLLTKESGVLSYGLSAAWLLGVLLCKERYWRGAVLLVLGGVASVAGCVLVWSLLAGGVPTALSAVNHSFRSGGGAWAAQNCSGPWYQFYYMLWIVGPATAALALAGAVVAAHPRQLFRRVERAGQIVDPRAAGVATFFTLGFFAFSAFVPNFQYLRIIGPADGPYCLLAGLGLWYLLSLARGTLPESDYRALVVLVAVGIAIAAARDYHTFRSLVDSGMEDFAVRFIRDVMQR
jgi:4-amino-4-deoxy-L-arabinose transferase-like glycosyltransferase